MRPLLLAATTSLLALAAACGANGEPSASAPQQAGTPVETRPANAPDQQPAFASQTRAPGVRTEQTLAHTVVASGLVQPWGLAMLPDGRWLVTELQGRLRIVTADGQVGEPIAGLPAHKGELEVERIVGRMAARSVPVSSVPSFLGAGVYKHHVPDFRRTHSNSLRRFVASVPGFQRKAKRTH
jgi:glucose/arabinose dehydrogenase